jgi:hypothetical protein
MGRSRFDATGAPAQHASQAGPLQAGAPGSGSGQVGARFMEGVGTVMEGVGTVAAGSTPAGELGRVPLRVAQSIKMLSKKKKWVLLRFLLR